jgi:hypothetical protein
MEVNFMISNGEVHSVSFVVVSLAEDYLSPGQPIAYRGLGRDPWQAALWAGDHVLDEPIPRILDFIDHNFFGFGIALLDSFEEALSVCRVFKQIDPDKRDWEVLAVQLVPLEEPEPKMAGVTWIGLDLWDEEVGLSLIYAAIHSTSKEKFRKEISHLLNKYCLFDDLLAVQPYIDWYRPLADLGKVEPIPKSGFRVVRVGLCNITSL